MVLIQESKMEILEVNFIKTIWSSMDIGWESLESYGASGGILTLWDKSKITVVETIRGHGLLCARSVVGLPMFVVRVVIERGNLFGQNY